MRWFDLDDQEALIGIHHVGYTGAIEEDDFDSRTVQMLARALNIRNLIAFIGSGVSRAYGHPGWDEFVKALVEFTLEKSQGSLVSAQERKLLESFGTPASTADTSMENPLSRADRNILILDLCEAICHRVSPAGDISIQREASKIFSNNNQSATIEPKPDPLLTLIQVLGIRRFLTTNYDTEIERAFERAGIRSDDFPPKRGQETNTDVAAGPAALSLSPEPQQLDALARFGASAPGFEYGVFHLHGKAVISESMLLTERDYQRLYLLDEPIHRAYRQALEIVFGGNAILFLGVGMSEGDLLRPLRQFVSERSGGGHERPLFAILRKPKSIPDAVAYQRYLYVRFGVKTLYYEFDPESGTKEEEVLTRLLQRIEKKRQHWWRNWKISPPSRKIKFYSPQNDKNLLARHYVELPPKVELRGQNDILDRCGFPPDKRAMVIVGSPGAGKGTVGQLLAELLKDKYPKRFFATAHFTNDLQSIIEGAASFFRGGSLPSPSDAFKELEQELLKGTHLFVLGGIERLLRRSTIGAIGAEDVGKSDVDAVGTANGPEAIRLFDLVQKIAETGNSSIVLTSTIWPAPLKRKDVHLVKLPGIEPAAVEKLPSFKNLDGLPKELCDVLEGHAYALVVIAAALDAKERSDEKREFLEGLIARLSVLDRGTRPATAVLAVWEDFLQRRQRNQPEQGSGCQSLFNT